MIGSILARAIWPLLRPKRPPDLIIGPSKDDPYMLRWWVIPRNHRFNIYLHNMRHDDDDGAAHDHPWWSLSLCLRGYIREYELLPESKGAEAVADAVMRNHKITRQKDRWYRVNEINQGDWKWRSETYAHRLTLPEGEAWTLFFTGPKVREWGFHCPKGWIPWRTFLGSDRPGQPRRGCGETE